MMNRRILLSKKRLRQRKSISHQSNEQDSPMIEIDGYNVIELLYTESLSKNELSKNDNLLELNEINSEKIDSVINIDSDKDIISRRRLKEIEEYYTSQYGITKVNENCFICLMTNFLSNELLYFSSKNNLFDYCKHCFVNKKKKLFLNGKICERNKEQFFCANINFINSWRFFIPKTICKGCFLHLINQRNIIYNIKNIFSDTDKDSSCKTNYRNYAKFSKLFRRTFKIGKHQKKLKKEKNDNIDDIIYLNDKGKEKIETIELSDSCTIDINSIEKKNTKNSKKLKYNKEVEFDKINEIIYINKSIFKDNKTNTLEKKIKRKRKKLIFKEHKVKKKERFNNIINFQGQNYINIINHININPDNSINNTNSISNYIELMLNRIKNCSLDINKLEFSIKNLFDSIDIIYSYTQNLQKKLLTMILYYPNLLKDTKLYADCNYLFFNFEDNKNRFYSQIINLKKNFDNTIDYIDNIYNKIDSTDSVNNNEKTKLLTKVKDLKLYINENIKMLGLYTNPIDNFIQNFYCLLFLINEITSGI